MEYIPTPEEQQEYLAYDSSEVFFANLETGLQNIKEYKLERRRDKLVLLAGAMVVFDKGTIDFLNRMADKDQGNTYFLLSEVTAEYRRKTSDMIHFNSICTPHLLAKEIVVPYLDIPVNERFSHYLQKRQYLSEAADNLKTRHKNMGVGYAEVLVCYMDLYLRELLDKIRPDCVIMWNEFYAFHTILNFICGEKKIPVQYMEFGCVPGTFVIEKSGQQGESFPARHPMIFRGFPVKKREIQAGCQVTAYICSTGLNRNIQPKKGRLAGLVSETHNRPVITYMGQNDYESGLYPYTRRTKKYHSPVFKSTVEALEYLRLICIKKDWRLLYKPHPIMKQLGCGEVNDMENEICVLDDVNIDEVIDYSNVVVTILSQSAYTALFRGKAVVMLGYTQLRGSGCVYEAFSKSRIEKRLKEALYKGRTVKQVKSFERHIAQLLKYYLFDDGRHCEMPFGKMI